MINVILFRKSLPCMAKTMFICMRFLFLLRAAMARTEIINKYTIDAVKFVLMIRNSMIYVLKYFDSVTNKQCSFNRRIVSKYSNLAFRFCLLDASLVAF